MAARSVASVPADRVEALLTAAPIPSALLTSRGSLSERQQAASLPIGAADPESLAAAPLPTPNSATMEATIRTIATPRPVPAAAPGDGAPLDPSVWDRLAHCESSGNWAINTGNGYYGGLQFSYSTWLAYGGGAFAEYAHLATREQQILIAENLHARRGFQPWPACRIKLGLP
jgi:hypothetical protein